MGIAATLRISTCSSGGGFHLIPSRHQSSLDQRGRTREGRPSIFGWSGPPPPYQIGEVHYNPAPDGCGCVAQREAGSGIRSEILSPCRPRIPSASLRLRRSINQHSCWHYTARKCDFLSQPGRGHKSASGDSVFIAQTESERRVIRSLLVLHKTSKLTGKH